MSLSFHEGEIPVAIVGTKKLYLNNGDHEEGHKSILLKGDATFQPIPSNSERDVLYVSGMSGSGKSYYVSEFVKQYHSKFPKRPIYIFSSIDQDACLDKLKYTKRVDIKKPAFLEEVLEAKDFEETCCIFDDCDVLTNKAIKKQVFLILNSILETGRHFKTTCIFTSHCACNGLQTKIILNEATSITVFPKTSGNKALNYLADTYLGLDKKQTAALKCVAGRWITVVRAYPRCVLTEKTAYMLN